MDGKGLSKNQGQKKAVVLNRFVSANTISVEDARNDIKLDTAVLDDREYKVGALN